jgi:hypothetical protein
MIATKFMTSGAALALAVLVGCTMPQGPQATVMQKLGISSSTGDLLYVADTKNSIVDLYAYPKGTAVGTLTGFAGLAGMCVDAAGRVYIPSYGSSQIYVYAHGATSPLRPLDDPSAAPYSCAIDGKTGDLAVTNYSLAHYTYGNVVVYKHAKGSPLTYPVYGMSNEYFCAYDNAGDLFVEGTGAASGFFVLEELLRGERLFSPVNLENVPAYANGLQWMSNYLAIGTGTLRGSSTGNTYIYHVQVSRLIGKTIGVTAVQEHGPTASFFIDDSTVVVTGGEKQANIGFFAYPKGGSPTQSIKQSSPYGVVVSAATSK